jgi:hypothetical protein
MAILSQKAARLISPAKVLYFPEATGQSFKAGEFVKLVSGKVTISGVDNALTKIAGMALADASGTADTAIPVAVAEEGVLFELCVYHATAGSAITAVTQVGASYGLTISSNKHYVQIAETGFAAFHVKALSPKDVVGDRYGRLLVEVLGRVCQLSGQTS